MFSGVFPMYDEQGCVSGPGFDSTSMHVVTRSKDRSTTVAVTHLIQRPCYQRGSPCQDPAGNWTTRRSPDDRKEMQTEVVWSCFPCIRSGQNHLARHSERGKKTRRTKEEVGRQHQGMDRPGVRQVPEGSGVQGKMEETGRKIICGAPTTLAVKGLMMMMILTITLKDSYLPNEAKICNKKMSPSSFRIFYFFSRPR